MSIGAWQLIIGAAVIIIGAAVILGVTGFATWFDKRNRAKRKYELPYRWGYFLGGTGVISSPLSLLIAVSFDWSENVFWFLLLSSGIGLASSIGLLMRATWGWALFFASYAIGWLAPLGDFAPPGIGYFIALVIFVIVNGVYASKRWTEMKQAGAARVIGPSG